MIPRTRLLRILPSLALALALAPGVAHAIRPDEVLKDPKLEARARSIDKDLRCLVCQNESIDDSDADLAHDLRLLVRQRLVAGDSDEQVKAFIVARYGNYVLLKPPLIGETYLLWAGPAFFLLVAAGTAWLYYRRRALQAADGPLSSAERRRIDDLIERVRPDDAAGGGN